MKFFKTIKIRKLRHLFVIIYIFTIILIAIFSLQLGFSQYYSQFPENTASENRIAQSIGYDPTNPNAYKAQGILLQRTGKFQAAQESFIKAIELDPNDYLVWLNLGFTYFKLEDFDNSQKAYQEAVRLAPNYFEPQLYLGLFFLKQNDPNNAFIHLSNSVKAKPELLPEIIKLGFQTFSGNGIKIENAIQLNSIAEQKTLALFFIKNKIVTDKTILFLTGRDLDDSSKNQFIEELIKQKDYQLAFLVWVFKEKNIIYKNSKEEYAILNGDFEEKIDKNEIGFGWLLKNEGNIKINLNNDNSFNGKKNLEIEFNGKSNPTSPIISQLVMAKPNQKYQLEFVARNEEFVSGGLPIIGVSDSDTGVVLGQTSPFPKNDQWQKNTLVFTTTRQTKAITIRLWRLNCPQSPCPAFGRLWLDAFKLKII